MQITDAGKTLVISELSEADKARVMRAIKEPKEQAPPQTIDRKGAAKIFGVHPGSLKRWEKAGKITPIRITPRTVRYDLAEIAALVGNRDVVDQGSLARREGGVA
ncbi:MAG: MerR family transcriptional regulator [Pontiellaceae bacterium]|nr:MerR family transcriptional regulator [Pontiellaceae bacterium]MBN2785365.1 MerR family transcriptional regulator [Pontiellaceae bacterium]